MDTSQLLLWGGAAVMAASVLAGLASAVILRLTGKRLRRRLEEEFGKRRH